MASKFNNVPPPANYVAGLGRGATGFTTRSDIGPARAAPEPGNLPEVVQGARPMDEDDKEDYSEANYDHFSGYGGSLWKASDPYDHDDKEADDIYEDVDKKMDERRKSRREAKLREEILKFRQERPKVQQQFADLKRDLSKVSEDDWANIPEIGDYTVKKKKRVEKYTPVPDSILAKAKTDTDISTTVDAHAQQMGGLATPLDGGVRSGNQDLTQIGQARKTVLNMKLHQVSDSVSGQTVVDPKGYLTDLNSIKISSDAEIGDIKKARLLLKSVTSTNPSHAPGWIAAARLEELAGKLSEARRIIANGCSACPKNADVWLEASRLNPPAKAKVILARAVEQLPSSVKVWMRAADLEKETVNRKRVLRKALEYVPNSVRLWKAAVELEGPEDARILLSRATECVPHSVEMWIALAHLETYENARKVLNAAREANPTHPQIWITAAKLEDANGNEEAVQNIVAKAISSLAGNEVYINREQWLEEAVKAEKADAITTCQAIVKHVLPMGVEEEDRKRTWMDDADNALEKGAVHTARAIFAHTLSVFPAKKSVWLRLAFLEKAHGTSEALDQVLSKGVSFCPQADILWLMGAKEKWLAGHIDEARQILLHAHKANPTKENIWLAAVKLENENKAPERARNLLDKARKSTGTPKVWRKSIQLEREIGDLDRETELMEEGLKIFPNDPKLMLMRAETAERKAAAHQISVDDVRPVYSHALRVCPNHVPLWIAAARWDERASATKARSLLEQGRLQNPKSPLLWLEAVRVEMRAGNMKVASSLMAKALQECPASGELWSTAIMMEPRPRQKAKSFDALKKCDQDPYVICTVARIFWMDLKFDKAKRWFNRVVTLAPEIGDMWAWFYKFLVEHGKEGERKELLRRCKEAAPGKGEYWRHVAHEVENAHKPPEELLLLVVQRLGAANTADLGPASPVQKEATPFLKQEKMEE